MEVGLALPQMTAGLDRDRLLAWCRGIDAGPFSSVSAGERITFDNLDGFTLCATAAATTERVRVLFNVAVAPWHAPAMLAMQLASIDVVSGGRVEVAVGVGGREQDYAALGSPFTHRLERLDAAVAEVRRLWSGGEAAGGGQVGPRPVRPDGPRVLCSATGPRSLARAARWADGLSGFTLAADVAEVGESFRAAEDAWAAAGRTERPRLVTGAFVALGPGAAQTLEAFGRRYLRVFGERPAQRLAARMPLHDDAVVRRFLTELAGEGCDEVILVPATNDLALLDRLTEVVAR
jgi:alkanesulfonate monooxygenase SsuD/methylene tetrahydromethanopterin reductase-like flavin-dependent oxidoreductase (luciferase family)